jgi:N6-L-threonylcarbamoyladenine synthase
LRDLPSVAEEAFHQAGLGWQDIQGVAATHGPGLMGALLVGLTWGKAAAFARSLPFMGVNHLEGHLLAAELEKTPMPRPLAGLVASGGHTNLYLIEGGNPPAYQLLASTRDDAVGEAFDKVAKLLGLPYPGGPAIEAAARSFPAPRVRFTLPRMKDGSLEFSYSGLKTAVRNLLDQTRRREETVDSAEIAAAFQQTVIKDLMNKTFGAMAAHGVKTLILTGGVAANRPLREAFAAEAGKRGLSFYSPPREWCTDNAAMIALAGARRLASGERSPWDLAADPNLKLQ